MGTVTWRHGMGLVIGALAAWLVILAFLSLYAALYGQGFLSPFQGSRDAFGLTGTTGLVLLLLLDLVIPFLAGVGFLLALLVLSRTRLTLLGFSRRRQAAFDGLLLGTAVWALLYVPVILVVAGIPLHDAVTPLTMGLIDHLAFGATMVLVIFHVGGPVRFGGDPASAPGP